MLPKLQTDGYYLLPPAHLDSLGGPGLMLLLNAYSADQQSYAVVPLMVAGNVERRHFGQTQVPTTPKPVAPGVIEFSDHKGTQHQFLVFGGQVSVSFFRETILLTITAATPVISSTEQRFDGLDFIKRVEAYWKQNPSVLLDYSGWDLYVITIRHLLQVWPELQSYLETERLILMADGLWDTGLRAGLEVYAQ